MPGQDDWTLFPPREFFPPDLARIYRPAGFMLLAETINEAGTAWFGDEWNGRELRARGIVTLRDLPKFAPRHRTTYNPRSRRRIQVNPTTPSATTEADRAQTAKEVEAARAEVAARKRFEDVVWRLRQSLNAGELKGHILANASGRLYPIRADWWASDQAPAVFELGDEPFRWHRPNETEIWLQFGAQPFEVSGPVLLKESELRTYLSGSDLNRDDKDGREGPGLAKFSGAQLRAWYVDYVRQCEATNRRPSRDDDLQAVCEHFGAQIPREAVRRIRRELAPQSWRKGGRRKTGGD